MFGRRSARRIRRRDSKPFQAGADRRLGFELLEVRRLLAGDVLLSPEMPAALGEGEGCSLFARVERLRVSTTTPKSVDVVFNGNMTIQPMINDGTIVDAVLVHDLRAGLIPLAADAFSYDEALNTLSVMLPGGLEPGYVQLELDGSAIRSCGGLQLEGGASGLQFEVPQLADEQAVSFNGATIDVDNYSVPSLADWNSDGLLDLIVGEKTESSDGKVQIYLNQGAAGSPSFGDPFYAQQVSGDVTVPASGCLGAFPRVADWDGDGLQDLVVGQADGSVQVFLNTNTAVEPRFGAPQLVLVGQPGAKAVLDVGARATPAVVDWNADGRLDLVVGGLDGRLRLYVNEASSGVPDFREELVLQAAGSDVTEADGRSSPAVVDFDGDGRKDLVVGNTAGTVRFYRNVGTDAAPEFAGAVAVTVGGIAIDLPGSPRSRPFVGDFNNDQQLDLLVGAEDGVVRLYSATAWNSPSVPAATTAPAGDPYIFTFTTVSYAWHNSDRAADATGDGTVDVTDIDQLIDAFNSHSYHDETGTFYAAPLLPLYCDVSDDGLFTPRDVLLVIHGLRYQGQGASEADAEGEGMLPGSLTWDAQADPASIEKTQGDDRFRFPVPRAPSSYWYSGPSQLLVSAQAPSGRHDDTEADGAELEATLSEATSARQYDTL
jgi:hypothetical protein